MRGDLSACAEPLTVWSPHAYELGRTISRHLLLDADDVRTQLIGFDVPVHRLGADLLLPAHVDVSLPERAVLAAMGIGADLRRPWVLANWSAAWVYLGGAPPERPAVAVPHRARTRGGVTLHQFSLSPADILTIGGCPVMSPSRVAADLLRTGPDDPGVIAALQTLLERGWTQKTVVRERIHEIGPGRNSRRSLEALERL